VAVLAARIRHDGRLLGLWRGDLTGVDGGE